ncbi:MAG TPA: LysR substrate-binding domain-containing protein [Coleofasciculaceae cyanobacterium]|jgi:DNA-binding transcriptional LysR family regulator
MELRHLRYFIAVAEELHFTRAAERLQIAQPPLSQQIRSLEEELGVQLFKRTKRRVNLTEAGQVFLEEARQVLIQFEQAVQAAKRASRGEIGRLAVGVNSSATQSFLPSVLQVFRERFPCVKLVLHELASYQQVQGIHDNRIDIGFLWLANVDDSALSFLPMLREPLIVALPETHSLANLPQIPLNALANEPFVLPPRQLGAGFYSQIISFCQQAGFSPKIAQEARLTQTIVSLVAGGVGISLVPASLQNLQKVGVVYKSLEGQQAEMEMAAVWRRDNSSQVLQEFLKVVREIAQLVS